MQFGYNPLGFGSKAGTRMHPYFSMLQYTGNAANGKAVTGARFSPEAIIIRPTDAVQAARLKMPAGVVSGPFDNIQNHMDLSAASAIGSDNSFGGVYALSSFDADGFTVNFLDSGLGDYNQSAKNYIAYCMKRSIDYGIDFQTYTGTGSGLTQNVAHSLLATPDLIVTVAYQNLTGSAGPWYVGSSALGYGNYLKINATDAMVASAIFGTPSASTFGATGANNELNTGYLSLLFRTVGGFIKVGSYDGNGDGTNGVLVGCDLTPRFLLIKSADSTGDWILIDSTRDTDNPRNKYLKLNSSAVEQTHGSALVNFATGGFVAVDTTLVNASSNTYLYVAIA